MNLDREHSVALLSSILFRTLGSRRDGHFALYIPTYRRPLGVGVISTILSLIC